MIGRLWLEPLKDAVDKGRGYVNRFNAWMRNSEEQGGWGHKAVSYGVAGVAGLVALRGAMVVGWLGAKVLGLGALARFPGVVAVAKGAAMGLGFALKRLAMTSLVGGALFGGYKLVAHWTSIKSSLTGIWADLRAAAADDSQFGSQKRRDAQDKFGQKVADAAFAVADGIGLNDLAN